MQYKITVCYKMEDLLYIYAYTDIQLRIDCRCLVVGFLYNSGGLQPPQQAIRKKYGTTLSELCPISMFN